MELDDSDMKRAARQETQKVRVEAIQSLVAEVVRERLSETAIQSVKASSGVDDDGDPVVYITVVFDTKNNLLDTEKVLGLARHLKAKFADEEINRFPIFRYISKKDAAHLKHEAA